MSGSLGVSLRRKSDALAHKLSAQRGEVLDNAVVNDCDASVEGNVGVGVLISGSAVGGPPSVTDTLSGLWERMDCQLLLEMS